jgi:hypothetical protein
VLGWRRGHAFGPPIPSSASITCARWARNPSAWAHLKLSVQDFLEFLVDRVKLHGRVWCGDELEMVGAYIQHGPFRLGETKNTKRFLAPDYSSVFDDIFRAEQRGETIRVTRSPRIESDAREELRRSSGTMRTVAARRRGKKVGRNDPCPCRSGAKFKKCCGK